MYLTLWPGSDSSQSFLHAPCKARAMPRKERETSCFWLGKKGRGSSKRTFCQRKIHCQTAQDLHQSAPAPRIRQAATGGRGFTIWRLGRYLGHQVEPTGQGQGQGQGQRGLVLDHGTGMEGRERYLNYELNCIPQPWQHWGSDLPSLQEDSD